MLVDLRDHGDSTIEDGLWAANTEEYRYFGYSGGTGGIMIAMGEEPRIATAWLDASTRTSQYRTA